MGKIPEVPPAPVLKASHPRHREPVDEAVGQAVLISDSRTSQAQTLQSNTLMRPAIKVFKGALPKTDPKIIGGFFANVLNLWETGQKLDSELLKIKKYRLSQDREQMKDFLIWISAIQIDMAAYWIGELKRDLPKLLRALDKPDIAASDKRKRIPSADKETKGSPSKRGIGR